MSKVKPHIARFDIGEWDTSALARTDIDNADQAAEIQENILPYRVGKGLVRPGTTWLGDTQGRIIREFVRSPTEKALLEIGPALLRVWIDDAVVTRPAVTATVANGDFSAGTGWTANPTQSGATSTVGFSGEVLRLGPNYQGTTSWREQAVVCNEPGVEHALEIWVALGACQFQVGTFSGGDDLVAKSTIRKGRHSLAFTPTGTFYIRFTQITADRITDIAECVIAAEGPMVITTPWVTDADLDYFQFDQSADVVFCANRAFPPTMIERRGDTSWSVTYFEPEDGPFQLDEVPGQGEVGIKVDNNTDSNTGFTENGEVLTSEMDGALFRAYHPQMDKTARLAGDNEYTDVYQVSGIRGVDNNDRKFTYDIDMTGSGTITFERSVSGENGDFNPTPRARGTSSSTTTGSLAATHQGNDEDNNVLAFHRIGFSDAGHGGSGNSATIRVTYQGDSGYGVGRFITITPGGGSDGDSFSSERLTRVHNNNSVTKSWSLGAWSSYYEWPSGVALFDNRLWWGGASRLWGSAEGLFFSFDDLVDNDTATIQRDLSAGGQTSQTNFLLPLQNMIIGTSGSELSLKASAIGEIMTPTTASLKAAGSFGSLPVEPVRIDQDGLFIHRDGVTSLLLRYDGRVEDYSIEKLTELATHVLESGCRSLAVQRQPETYVWHVRNDGQVAVLNLEQTEDGVVHYGWSRYVSSGLVEDVAVLPEDDEDGVYFITGYTPPEDASGADTLVYGLDQYVSVDFTDGSSTSTKSGSFQSTGTGSDGAFSYVDIVDEWGRPTGTDAIVTSWDIWTVSGSLTYTRKDDGRYTMNYHNFVAFSEDLDLYREFDSVAFENTEVELDGIGIGVRYEAPNGQQSAQKIVPTTDNDYHWVVIDSGAAGFGSDFGYWDGPAEWTSVYMRAGEYQYVDLFFSSKDLSGGAPFDIAFGQTDKGYGYVRFNLADGTFVSQSQVNYPDLHGSALLWQNYLLDYRIERESDWPDGWYRYMIKWKVVNRSSLAGIRVLDNSQTEIWAGDGTSGIYVFGIQGHYEGAHDDRYIYSPPSNFKLNDRNVQLGGENDPFNDGSGRDGWKNTGGRFLSPIEWEYPATRVTSEGTSVIEGEILGLKLDTYNPRDDLSGLEGQGGAGGEGSTYVNPDIFLGGLDDDDRRKRKSVLLVGTQTDVVTDIECPDGTFNSTRYTFKGALTGDIDVGGLSANYYGTVVIGLGSSISCDFWIRPESSFAPGFVIAFWDEDAAADISMPIWNIEFSLPGNQSAPVFVAEYQYDGDGGSWPATQQFNDRYWEIEPHHNGWYRIWATVRYDKTYASEGNIPSSSTMKVGLLLPWGAAFPAVNRPHRTYDETAADVQSASPAAGVYNWHVWNWRIQESYVHRKRPHKLCYGERMQGSGLPHSAEIVVRDEINWKAPTTHFEMWQEVQQEGYIHKEWVESHTDDNLYYTDQGFASLFHEEYVDDFFWKSFGWVRNDGALEYSWDGETVEAADEPGTHLFKGYDGCGDLHDCVLMAGRDEIYGPATQDEEIWQAGWAVDNGRRLSVFNGATIGDQTAFGTTTGPYGTPEPLLSFGDITIEGNENDIGALSISMNDPQTNASEPGTGHMRKMVFTLRGDLRLEAGGPGSSRRVLEKLNRHSEAKGSPITKMGDAGAFYAGPIQNITHPPIALQEVVAWGTRVSDGEVGPITGLGNADNAGNVDLGDSYTNVFVGAAYTARYKSGRLAFGGEGGTAMEQPKRVSSMGVLLQDTHRDAIKFGSDFDNLRSMPIVSKGAIQPANQIYSDYDDVMFTFPGLWDTDSRAVIQVDAPYPATFTGLVYGVETEVRGGRNTKGRSRSKVKRRGRGR